MNDRIRLLLSAALAALVLLVAPAAASASTPATTAPTACAGVDLDPVVASNAKVRGAILCLLNEERVAKGLRPLVAESRLRAVATTYGAELVRDRFFAHVSPSGSTLRQRVQKTSYLTKSALRRWRLGENLAWGTGARSTPRQIVAGWMASPAHRANVLDGRFREIGIGAVAGAPQATSKPGTTFVTVFGLRVAR